MTHMPSANVPDTVETMQARLKANGEVYTINSSDFDESKWERVTAKAAAKAAAAHKAADGAPKVPNIAKQSGSVLKNTLAKITDVDTLAAVFEAEKAGANRPAAIKAIEARHAELTPQE